MKGGGKEQPRTEALTQSHNDYHPTEPCDKEKDHDKPTLSALGCTQEREKKKKWHGSDRGSLVVMVTNRGSNLGVPENPPHRGRWWVHIKYLMAQSPRHLIEAQNCNVPRP
ncbi:hypothetical protein TNCV_2655151 [Trichonephila clavipes]|nr:hypothetical protein TNCV_2655151 [Trichonephila clavipes]